jgi:CRISPR/Cas system-associated endonuclease Cas1
MHEGGDGSSAFIFDLMEPHRSAVDREVLEFVKGHTFEPADFVIRSDGVCRLTPEMAGRIAQLSGFERLPATAKSHRGGYLLKSGIGRCAQIGGVGLALQLRI